MEQELNLVEILKDCPQGTKLYSIMHGEVEFKQIKYNVDYPIVFKYKGKDDDLKTNSEGILWVKYHSLSSHRRKAVLYSTSSIDSFFWEDL